MFLGVSSIMENKILKTKEFNKIIIEKVLSDKSIAMDLIFLFDDLSYEQDLYTEAFGYLERVIRGSEISEVQKACIITALTFIALKYYDGDFYSYVAENFYKCRQKNSDSVSNISIQNAVRKVVDDFRPRVKYFDLRSHVAVPIVLCIVPFYRVKDLFKISYDIYKQKLLYDEDLTDEQINEKVLETLIALRRKDLVSNADVIKGTSYLMSKYTQSCIYSGVGTNDLSKIITHCIRLIISYLSLPEDAFVVEPYFEEGYKVWVDSFRKDERERSRYESNRHVSQPFFRLVKAERYEIHLCTGKCSMDDSFDPKDVHICIYNGNALVLDKLLSNANDVTYMDSDGALNGYIIERQDFVMGNTPLGELSYKVICEGKEVYSSKTRLFKTCLLFDGKGNEVKPGTNYNGQIFVVTKKSIKDEYNDVHEVSFGNGYIVSLLDVNNKDVFVFDGEPFIFYNISAAKLVGYDIPWVRFNSFEGKTYHVFQDATILVPASCGPDDIYVEVDGQQYRLDDYSDISFSVRLFSKGTDGVRVYSVKIYGLTVGYHNVKIFNAFSGKRIRGANIGFVYDEKIWKSFVKKDETGILYNLKSSFFDEDRLLFEYGSPKKEIRGFVKDLGPGSFSVLPSSISYSFDGVNWFDIDRKMYLSEISKKSKSVFICGPEGMTACFYDSTAVVKKQFLNFVNDGEYPTLYKLDLSYLWSIGAKISARILFEFGSRCKFMDVWYNPYVQRERCEFVFDRVNKKHLFKFVFEGNSKVKAVISPFRSDVPICEKVVSSGDVIEVEDSVIDSNIKYLSISLHGKNFGSLFEPYHKEPFMVFPKYDLQRPAPRLLTYPPEIKVNNYLLSACFDFTGTEKAAVEIVPSGFTVPLYSEIINSGSNFTMDISLQPFNSYIVLLYSVDSKDLKNHAERHFFKSKQIKVPSPFLHQVFLASKFILNDGTAMKAYYTVKFKTITLVRGEYYLVASLKHRNDTNGTDYLAKLKTVNKLQYEFCLYYNNGSNNLRPISLKNGKTVSAVVLEKRGIF